MSQDRFQRVAELFEAARELAMPDRDALLDRECAGDNDLRSEVEALLGQHESSSGLLADAAALPTRPEPEPEATTMPSPGVGVGTTLGPFEIREAVGEGGMGQVFRAEVGHDAPPLPAGSTVAIKVVHPHLMATPGSFKRFLREAEIGKQVRHENVVRTFDADALNVGGHLVHYLVMEYVEGKTLRALLQELERVPEGLCRHVGREVARGLCAMHALGAVHRDLKLENVLICADESVKIMDLGVALVADEAIRLSHSGLFVGSLLTAAPEQLDGSPQLDGRVDLYALGLMLYELATARHPFQSDSKEELRRRLKETRARPIGELNPQLSPFFEEVVQKLIAVDRERRFASAAEVLQILEEGERSPWWRDRAQAIREETKSPLRRVRIPRTTALYGRDTELQKLQEAWTDVVGGEARVLLIEGEAGIGKTRLVDEFVGQLPAAGERPHFLFGGHPPGGAATAAGAVAAAFREHFGEHDLESRLQPYLQSAPALVHAFAALLRGQPAPRGSEPLTKESQQTAFVYATRALAAERPLVLLVDDLHFAPDEGRALFMAMALAVAPHRVLLIGTSRPGLEGEWTAALDRLEYSRRIGLDRLRPRDLGRLLTEALQSEQLAHDLGFEILTKSDGNPYFVFEILRGLREANLLRQKKDGSWTKTSAIHEIQVPSTLLDLIQVRISELSREDRTLLEVAACCGFEFDPLLVGEVLGLGRIPLLQSLANIENRHRLVRAAGRRYVFDHHQIQEALYANLPDLLREEYHGVLGQALEQRALADGKEPEALDGDEAHTICDQYLKGGEGAKAMRYLDAALGFLERGYQNQRAIETARGALDAPELLDGARRAEVLLHLAEVLERVGRRPEQEQAFEEALALSEAAGDTPLRLRALRALVRLRAASGDIETAATHAEACVTLARETGDPAEQAQAALSMGGTLVDRGAYAEAMAPLQEAERLAREAERPVLVSQVMTRIADLCAKRGDYDAAIEGHERAIALAQEQGADSQVAHATGAMGTVYYSLGRYDRSAELYEAALERTRAVGDRRAEAMWLGNLGTLDMIRGKPGAGLQRFETSRALSQEIGVRSSELWGIACCAEAERDLGRIDAARQNAEICAQEADDPRNRGYAFLVLAEVALFEGRADQAAAQLEGVFDAWEPIGYRSGMTEALLVRGRAHLASERQDEAREAFARCEELSRELQKPGTLVVAAAYGGWLDEDPTRALEDLREFSARLEVLREMEASWVLWKATQDATLLERAKRLLDDFRGNSPEADHDHMLERVPLYGAIATAQP